MTDEQVRQYLHENGYPAHIVKGGREGLIERWKQFAVELERGYEFGLEDYRNDLDFRAVIHMVDADGEVAEADARVQIMLTDTDVRIWESGDGNPWWDFGYPRNASNRLKRDLRAEGVED